MCSFWKKYSKTPIELLPPIRIQNGVNYKFFTHSLSSNSTNTLKTTAVYNVDLLNIAINRNNKHALHDKTIQYRCISAIQSDCIQ